MALTSSDTNLELTALFAVLLAFWTTTLEVAADGWRIELAPTALEQGPIVAANLWGYRSAMVAADARVFMAEQRVTAAAQAVEAARAGLHAAEMNTERQQTLQGQGLASQRQLELAELESARGQTEVARAQATLLAAQSELESFRAERLKVNNDATATVNDAVASRQVAEGEVANAALPARMAAHRFFFNPIRYTSLGLAVIEAMMVGTPVVGLATTELSSVIADGHNGLVDTRVPRLVDGMRRLLADPAEARRLGEAGRRTARERFHIDRFVADWMAALRSVTS